MGRESLYVPLNRTNCNLLFSEVRQGQEKLPGYYYCHATSSFVRFSAVTSVFDLKDY